MLNLIYNVSELNFFDKYNLSLLPNYICFFSIIDNILNISTMFIKRKSTSFEFKKNVRG